MTPKFYIYLHCTPAGIPFYVGKGSGVRAMKLNRKHNPEHQKLVARYGAGSIRIEIINCVSEEQAFIFEIHTIAILRWFGIKLVNQTNGGDGSSGWKPTEEQRYRYSMTSLGNMNALGNRGRAGQKHSEETKLKMRLAKVGKPNNWLGRKHSAKSIQKMIKARSK